jgi:hypothetical protein
MTDLIATPTIASLPAQVRRTHREPASAAALDELRALLPGQVLGPDDAAWETARLGWTVNVDQRPAAVVTVADVEDVVAVVRCAARHGLSVSAQPVGHGATEALTGTVLLRTAALQDIDIDIDRRVARVGAGVKWGDLLTAVEPTGWIAPAGSSPDPSVVGFTLGGGLSWFSRAIGTASRHVEAFEIVDAKGDRRRVTRTSHPDLFWAMCGGGGDFGIVTAMEMRLTDAGPVVGGRMMWPIEMAYPVLRAYRAATRCAPEELTMWVHLFRFPPLPELPEPIRGRSFVSVDLTYLGEQRELGPLLAQLREIPAQVMDSVGPVPLSRLGDIAAEPVDPMPAMELSGLLADLDETSVDRLLAAAGPAAEVPLAVVQIRHLGGELTRQTEAEGPQGGIAEEYQLFALGVPAVPELVPAIGHALAGVADAVSDQLTGRTFFNFRGSHADASSCFSEAAAWRLREVKAEVDPDGVFRSNRPTR